MKNYPKITIITACLNAVRTIETTIKSVLDQNYPNLEYIIIDGVSTDGTLDIADRYRDRITVIVSEPDKGIYDAFNKGIALATGDLIGILNADDCYMPWTLSTIRSCFLRSPDFDVYYGNIAAWNEKEDFWYSLPLMYLNEGFRISMMLHHPAVFVSKQAYEKYGIFSLSYPALADWEFLLRLYDAKARFLPIDMILAIFRLGGYCYRNISCNIREMAAISSKYGANNEEIIKYGKQYFSAQRIAAWRRKIKMDKIYFSIIKNLGNIVMMTNTNALFKIKKIGDFNGLLESI